METHPRKCPQCGASLNEPHQAPLTEKTDTDPLWHQKCSNAQCDFYQSVRKRHERYMEDLGWESI